MVDEVFDSRLEISLKDALAISSAYELGDKIKFEEAPAEFGRVAAQSAKQTIMEKMRKQTRTITYNTYKEHENEIMSGTVERFDNRFIYVNLGSIEAQLSKQDQIPGEVFQSHDRIEVFVYKVEDNPRGVNVFVSRSHPEMIKRLMEQEIPEVYDGTVEIMSVAREAGDRTKVAVRSHNPNVDAIGTIVGRGGSNIKKITSKFHPARYDQKLDRMVPTEENIRCHLNGFQIQLNSSTMRSLLQKWTKLFLMMKIANMLSLWFQIINYLLPSVVVVKTFVWQLI